MSINLPPKSLATNTSDTLDLYAYRKKYKKDILVNKGQAERPPEIGTADLWYDRNLYGRLDRKGNIIVARESFLRSLKAKDNKTYYTLNFVSLAFNQLLIEMNKYLAKNLIPSNQTVFRQFTPGQAFSAAYQPYHRYMTSLLNMFTSYLEYRNIEHRVSNFDDFVEEFFIFIRDNVTAHGSPFTFSSYVTSNLVPPHISGLIIDLFFGANPADDLPKQNVFVNDINFSFFKNLANKFGFAVDRNIPWRLIANLNSESMQIMMAQPAFDVTYQYGTKNLFDQYYIKTFILDYSLIREYIYAMYTTLLQYKVKYPESSYYVCRNNVGGLLRRSVPRKELTDYEKSVVYNYKDYWMEKVFRFRLLELKHDLKEEDIKYIMKIAKTLYVAKSPDHAYGFLNRRIKKYFLNELTEAAFLLNSGRTFPKSSQNIVPTSVGTSHVSFKSY